MRNGFYVQLIWVKGPSGIVGNALADQYAKEAALHQHENHESYNYAKQSTSIFRSLSKEKILENWKKDYNNYNNAWLKKFIPNIEDRFKLSSLCFATPEMSGLSLDMDPFVHILREWVSSRPSFVRVGRRNRILSISKCIHFQVHYYSLGKCSRNNYFKKFSLTKKGE